MVAEALGVTSAILAIVEFAFVTSKALYQQLSSLESHVDTVSNLKSDLSALTTLLGTLQGQLEADSIAQASEKRLEPIKAPLLETGKACKELALLLDSCTVGSSSHREVVKKWLKMQYKGKNIDETRALLASYKSTLAISLQIVNMRDGLQTQKSLNDLTERTQGLRDSIEIKLEDLKDALDSSTAERQSQLEEDRKALNDALLLCDQALQIVQQTRPLPDVILDGNIASESSRQFAGADGYDGTYNLSASHNEALGGSLQAIGLYSPETLKAISDSTPLATAHMVKVALQTTDELQRKSFGAASSEATVHWSAIQSVEDSESLHAKFPSLLKNKSPKRA